MIEKGILMTGENPKLIAEGRKTQTRRLIRPQPDEDGLLKVSPGVWLDTSERVYRCPYGVAGDRLWVRETFCGPVLCATKRGNFIERFYYKADHPHDPPRNHKAEVIKWKSPRFMPRTASRITLEITGVRVERLNDISEEDAVAEGVGAMGQAIIKSEQFGGYMPGAVYQYATLWESINGVGSWKVNPWIFAITFKKE